MLTKTGTQDVLTAAAVLLFQGVSAYTTNNSGVSTLLALLPSDTLNPTAMPLYPFHKRQ